MVATNSGLLADRSILTESNHGFYTEEGFDFEKIKSHCDDFVVLHSADDKWVPYESGVKNAKELNARFLSFDDRGHFGKDTPQVPELIGAIIPL